jgi:3D (Asp-Asp-Asp) domain-containing protein
MIWNRSRERNLIGGARTAWLRWRGGRLFLAGRLKRIFVLRKYALTIFVAVVLLLISPTYLDLEHKINLAPEPGAVTSKPCNETVASRSQDAMEIVVEATAYTHTGHKTYTGTWPHRGTIAVDPGVIPLGSRLYVEGYGPGVAEDTGGVIKGLKVDLFMETENECWEWGRRIVNVRILE